MEEKYSYARKSHAPNLMSIQSVALQLSMVLFLRRVLERALRIRHELMTVCRLEMEGSQTLERIVSACIWIGSLIGYFIAYYSRTFWQAKSNVQLKSTSMFVLIIRKRRPLKSKANIRSREPAPTREPQKRRKYRKLPRSLPISPGPHRSLRIS